MDYLQSNPPLILKDQPKDFPTFLQKLEECGYEVKQGKQLALRGNNKKNFIRLSSLGDSYTEMALREIIASIWKPTFKPRGHGRREKRVDLLIDIHTKPYSKYHSIFRSVFDEISGTYFIGWRFDRVLVSEEALGKGPRLCALCDGL